MLWFGFVVSQVHKQSRREKTLEEDNDDDEECDFLFKRGVLKVAWFLFLVNFFESPEGHKWKKCLSKSRETHVFLVLSSI
jgi:hypothetical protein